MIKRFLWCLFQPRQTSYMRGLVAAERADKDGWLFEFEKDIETDVLMGYKGSYYQGAKDYINLARQRRAEHTMDTDPIRMV